MRIAVIGSGISGMSAAYFLSQNNDVTLYEASGRLGGHTATVDVEDNGQNIGIDTGFIVYNDWTYPRFIQLMNNLKVQSQPTTMGFSVSDVLSGLEYAGTNLNTLFAQRRNIFSANYLTMLREILRFNRQVERDLAELPDSDDVTLGEYLEQFSYSDYFRDFYVIPMGAAIWSSKQSDMLKMPLDFFVKFFRNHGLLNLIQRPQWRVIKGGSKNYIDPLVKPYRDNIRLHTPVLEVERNVTGSYVTLLTKEGPETFDHVVFACHSNQALACLKDATELERELLSAIPYSKNEVALHTDDKMLPVNRRCWSSWNVHLGQERETLRLTYNMNILQGINSSKTYCVTLNQTEAIRPDKILGTFEYEHPVFSMAGIQAQKRWGEINGRLNTWFCGAYWRNGFHEDGVWSAWRVYEQLQLLSQNTVLRVA